MYKSFNICRLGLNPRRRASRRDVTLRLADGNNNNEKKKPDSTRPKPKPKPKAVRADKGQAGVVKKLLKKVEQKLSGDEVKASLGDYIRLVQLQKELEEEQPKEMKVTWVEPAETESESGK